MYHKIDINDAHIQFNSQINKYLFPRFYSNRAFTIGFSEFLHHEPEKNARIDEEIHLEISVVRTKIENIKSSNETNSNQIVLNVSH